jgi:hypothetical protein
LWVDWKLNWKLRTTPKKKNAIEANSQDSGKNNLITEVDIRTTPAMIIVARILKRITNNKYTRISIETDHIGALKLYFE